jgi:hypothetical protein
MNEYNLNYCATYIQRYYNYSKNKNQINRNNINRYRNEDIKNKLSIFFNKIDNFSDKINKNFDFNSIINTHDYDSFDIERKYRYIIIDLTSQTINMLVLNYIRKYKFFILEYILKNNIDECLKYVKSFYEFIENLKKFYDNSTYDKIFFNDFKEIFYEDHISVIGFHKFLTNIIYVYISRTNTNIIAESIMDQIKKVNNYYYIIHIDQLLKDIYSFYEIIRPKRGIERITGLFGFGGEENNDIIKTNKRVVVYYNDIKYKRNILIKNNNKYVKINNKLILI